MATTSVHHLSDSAYNIRNITDMVYQRTASFHAVAYTRRDDNSSELINTSVLSWSSDDVSVKPILSPETILEKMNKTEFQILTPSFILAVVLILVGIPGNLLALIVYLTKMKRNTASYFIIALTFSDLINCIFSLPVEMYIIANFWTFDFPMLCKFSRFLTASMNNTSSFILVAIAVERFRSICTPLKPRFTAKLSKAICLSVFTVAGMSALPMIWGYGTFTHTVVIQNVTVVGKTCLIDDHVRTTSYPDILLVYFFAGHLTVFLILSFLYLCIARKLIVGNHSKVVEKSRLAEPQLIHRKSSTFSTVSFSAKSNGVVTPCYEKELTINALSTSRSSVSSISTFQNYLTRKHGGHRFRTKRLTCMLFLMTSVFEISFIPYLTIVSVRNRHPSYYSTLNISGKMAYQFFLRFYLINCALNPIIYCFYNQNFRHGVKLLFASIKRRICREK